MKKGFFIILAAVVIVFITYKYLNKGEQADVAETEVTNEDPAKPATGIVDLLDAYYTVSDAFVASDTAAVSVASKALAEKMATTNFPIPLNALAEQHKATIQTEAANLTVVAGLETKRKSFQTASDALFALLQDLKYNNTPVYQIHCPMAFENTGANWLSKTTDVVNPYFGSQMLHCGYVKDSVTVNP